MEITVSCAVNAFVEATPISGPACVYIPALVALAMEEPTTLQMPNICPTLPLATSMQQVYRQFRLIEKLQSEVIREKYRVAVPEFRSIFNFNRYPDQFLKIYSQLKRHAMKFRKQ